MGLSSNTLWHQTKKEYILKILKEKRFYFSYSKEYIPNNEVIAFPMISLCDLPISEFADYINKYGGYSIGMTKEWGIRNGFNPVWYCNYNSLVIIEIKLSNIFDNIYSYIKPIDGVLKVRGKEYKNYRFMDEREVRLLPSEKEMNDNNLSQYLSAEEYNLYKKQNNNSSLIPLFVQFDWADIKYIIVKNPENKEEFKKLLIKYGCNFNNIQIFDINQIKEDFIGIGHNQFSKYYLPNDIKDKRFWDMANALSQRKIKIGETFTEHLKQSIGKEP